VAIWAEAEQQTPRNAARAADGRRILTGRHYAIPSTGGVPCFPLFILVSVATRAMCTKEQTAGGGAATLDPMTELMMQLADTVADGRGAFHVRVMARDCPDGRWEGWLEFTPDDTDARACYITPIETRQRDRLTMERWATGLTHVDAEGALARAQIWHSTPVVFGLGSALDEIVTALDHRAPDGERVGGPPPPPSVTRRRRNPRPGRTR
jgi:hypothetical protein